MALQLQSTCPRASVRLKNIKLMATTSDNVYYRVLLNPTINQVASQDPTYTALSESCVQYHTATLADKTSVHTVDYDNNGTVLFDGIMRNDDSSNLAFSFDELVSMIPLCAAIDGTTDTLALVATNCAGGVNNVNLFAVMGWFEIV